MMTPETERELKRAGRNVARWTDERDRQIQKALAEGGSLRVIGDLVGLSHTAVKLIGERPPMVGTPSAETAPASP